MASTSPISQLGRNRPGGDAIALLYLDAPFPEPILAKVRAHKAIDSAKRAAVRRRGGVRESAGRELDLPIIPACAALRPLVSASQMPPNTSTMAIAW